MKNFLLGALTIMVIVLVGYLIYQKSNPSNYPAIEESSVPGIQKETDKKLIGGDKDDHGCLIGGGYSWCEEKQKCLRTWEEECVESSKEEITEAMAIKYAKDMSEVTITISQEQGSYARGSVEFAPGGIGNAGMFLAVKYSDKWEIVYDGHGVPDCTQLKQTYNFPQNMLEGMCD